MRYSRIRRSRSRRRYFFILCIGLLLFGGIYFISAGAVGRYISNIIGPILAKDARSDGSNEIGADINDKQAQEDREELEFVLPESDKEDGNNQGNSDGRLTEDLKIEPINYFAIQVGAFNGIDNANLLAQEIKRKGGAGYIIEDDYFRVLAMAYTTEKDAEQVKNQLKEQEVESQIYRISCSGVNMEITATRDKIDGIKSSFQIWNEKLSQLGDIISDLDTNKITTEMAINKLQAIRDELESHRGKISEYLATNEGNPILEELEKLYQSQINNIDEILKGNVADRVAISANMKYNYIDMIIQFKKYIEKITKG